MRTVTAALVLALIGALLSGEAVSQTKKKSAAKSVTVPALVVVNGEAITDADLERVMKTRKVPEAQKEKFRRPFLDEMLDAKLVAQFLASKKIAADKKEVDAQVQSIKNLAAKSGGDPEQAIVEMGYTPETLREEFALPLAWKKYIDKTLTDDKLQKHFQSHREQFDGTRVHALQILVKVDTDDESAWTAAIEKLAAVRHDIVDGKLSFEEAALAYSEAPSKEAGGDVGTFFYSGKMPESFTQEAFKLQKGEISPPFRSRFGVHLCQVVNRIPGKLSLEDVREDVRGRLAQDLWRKTAADLKKSAKIEWKQ